MKHALTIGLLALSFWAGSLAFAFDESAIFKDLALLENRFFSHQYVNDPTDKRLERLELLVFGATQAGDLSERWTRLQKSIASRAQQPVQKGAPEAAAGTQSKAPETSSQYPILNTLEWRALKQTYPKEGLDARLGRLEKKLFGQDAPGMAYVDRVDRLKKTLGVGVTATLPSGPLGPGPKARPRGLPGTGLDSFVSPFGGGFGGTEIYGDEGSSGIPAPFSFGFNPSINSTFGQMFADMNKQMAELERLGPGSWVLDPDTNQWVDTFSGKRKPNTGSAQPAVPGTPKTAPAPLFVKPKPTLPQRQIFQWGQPEENKLPPYTDPNSI